MSKSGSWINNHLFTYTPYCDFCLPHLHSTPPLGGSRLNIAILFGMDKLEWCGYPTVKKIIRFHVIHECDRHTDR